MHGAKSNITSNKMENNGRQKQAIHAQNTYINETAKLDQKFSKSSTTDKLITDGKEKSLSKESDGNILVGKNQIVYKDSRISVVVNNPEKHIVDVQETNSNSNKDVNKISRNGTERKMLLKNPHSEVSLQNQQKSLNEEIKTDANDKNENPQIKVKVEDQIFEVDRKLIANKSAFINNILLKTNLPEENPHFLEDIKPAAFKSILNWMNLGELVIGPENIGSILDAAIKLEINEIVRICLQYRDLMLESGGFMRTYDFAAKYNIKDLKEEALSKMQAEFLNIVKSPAFLKFDIDQLCLLLDDDNLHLRSEKEVLDACVHWLTWKWESRQAYFSRALGCVRFPLMSTSTLVNLATGEEIDIQVKNDENQVRNWILNHSETQKKVFDALVFKGGLKCGLAHKVAHLMPKKRVHAKEELPFEHLKIENLDNQIHAATVLQAGLRGYNSRKLLKKKNEAAEKIQTWYREEKIRQKSNPKYILVLTK